MNLILRLICYALLFGLASCQGLQHNGLQGQDLAQCKVTCVQHFEFCKNNCVDNCPTCSFNSKKRAAESFNKYVYQSNVEGKKVMRELNSYRDPLQCRKVTCDCLSDFAICNKGCTGVIRKKLQAVPYCV